MNNTLSALVLVAAGLAGSASAQTCITPTQSEVKNQYTTQQYAITVESSYWEGALDQQKVRVSAQESTNPISQLLGYRTGKDASGVFSSGIVHAKGRGREQLFASGCGWGPEWEALVRQGDDTKERFPECTSTQKTAYQRILATGLAIDATYLSGACTKR
jgi:hypothetical protein